MPLIEELPTTTTQRASHGWAYVPDTGFPIAAVQPSTRKRGAARDPTSSATATAKQQKAIQQRLNDLDKENYKDVQIPIPVRKDRDKGRKMTSNVRRILTYQRTFAHYLADVEGGAGAGGGGSTMAPPAAAGLQKGDGKRKASEVAAGTPRRASGQVQRRDSSAMPPPQTPDAVMKEESSRMDVDTPTPTPAPTSTPQSQTPGNPSDPPAAQPPSYDPALDKDPLLRTRDVPKKPSDRVMEALVAELPLSYNAARATVAHDTEVRPVRHFCAICGYWGKIKCRKCGERVCGLMDCWKGHESVCPAVGY